MSYVKARPGESIDNLLRRFKKAVENSGRLSDFKKHEVYEKPSIRKKRKQAAARKRALKANEKLDKKQKIKVSKVSWNWNKDRTKKIYAKKSTNFKSNTQKRNNDTTRSAGYTNKPVYKNQNSRYVKNTRGK